MSLRCLSISFPVSGKQLPRCTLQKSGLLRERHRAFTTQEFLHGPTKSPCTSELKCPCLSLSWSGDVCAKLLKTGQWICCHNGAKGWSESVARRSHTLEQPTGQASQQSAWVRSALPFRTTLSSASNASYLDALMLDNAIQIFTCCTCRNLLCFAQICVPPSMAVRDF